MNKAQEKYTQDFREKYYGHNVTSKILHMFISGFTEIDPTPDPELYECVSTDKVISRGSSFTAANKWLTDLLRVTTSSEIITYERGKFLKTELNYFEIRKENE